MQTSDESAEAISDRILTIPNILSIIRLCVMPIFVWLLFGKDDRYAAAAVLAALGISDFADGYIARHFHQESKFGRIIDPIADRVLLVVALVCALIDGSVPLWIILLAAARELTVSIGTLIVAEKGHTRIDVIWFGKAGAFGLMVAIPLFFVASSDAGWADLANTLAYIAAIPALIFGWISVPIYISKARVALDDTEDLAR